MHPLALAEIAKLEAEGHIITAVISCHNYTRIVTNFTTSHIHH